MIAKRIIIGGIVQGVGYRAWVYDNARKLNLNGWVKNLKDGSVEALLQGEESQVARLIEQCFKGPNNARVEGIKQIETEINPNLTGFSLGG